MEENQAPTTKDTQTQSADHSECGQAKGKITRRALGAFLSAKSAEIYRKLEPKLIRHVTWIRDYMLPSTSPVPIVVHVDGQFFCTDGWEMVQAAIDANQPKLLCRVIYLLLAPGVDRRTELAIRKTAVRMKTQGGHASYAEKVNNFNVVFKMLMAGSGHPIMYRHGGRRDAGESGFGREEDIMAVIVERLGQERTTVLRYRTDTEELSEAALGELCDRNATRKYFEDAMPQKRRIVAVLQEQELPHAAIERIVSCAMLRMHAIYDEKKAKGMKEIAVALIFEITPVADDEEDALVPPNGAEENAVVTSESDETQHDIVASTEPVASSFEEVEYASKSVISRALRTIVKAKRWGSLNRETLDVVIRNLVADLNLLRVELRRSPPGASQ